MSLRGHAKNGFVIAAVERAWQNNRLMVENVLEALQDGPEGLSDDPGLAPWQHARSALLAFSQDIATLDEKIARLPLNAPQKAVLQATRTAQKAIVAMDPLKIDGPTHPSLGLGVNLMANWRFAVASCFHPAVGRRDRDLMLTEFEEEPTGRAVFSFTFESPNDREVLRLH